MQSLAVLCGLLGCIIVGWSLMSGQIIFGIAGGLLTLTPITLAVLKRSDKTARLILGITTPVYAAIFVALARDTGWVIDMHLTFFALLAMLAVLADWRPILAATSVTAVHHLLLNFVAPLYVFPDGSDFARVIFHAVVLLGESVALMFLCSQLESMIKGQSEERAERERLEAAAEAEKKRISEEQQLVLHHLNARLSSLSSGDMHSRIEEKFPSKYESLRFAVNETCEQLQSIFGHVNETADCVVEGAGEMRAASDDLGNRTARDSDMLDEVSSLSNKLAQDLGSTASLCEQTNEVTIAVKGKADDGKEMIVTASDAMSRIKNSASEIRDIIDLIDGIAFQTNLLALNAGVEAARAGESGKGFSVVAHEVRVLAQRATESATSIKELVEKSVHDVDEGTLLVENMSSILSTILEEFDAVDTNVSEISQRTSDTAGQFGKVSASIGNLNESMQQNAAMVEESNAAMHQLNSQADALKEIVSRFVSDQSSNGHEHLRSAA
ncbi:hypothetical protein EH31_09595 [Erythrobacter longus]|uniref:Methyl-accepting transducer domain-containing protein n=2 Tax=Erythrobacter longus TaxID=1044 RepID=A0A074MEP1_ERYLO|nr:hypothetical protein EH31_09595 [Erythrobacter longus]